MHGDTARLLLLVLGVLAGASSQRVTGLGFALVSSPLLVLVAGPFDGVLLANLLSLAAALAVLATTWRQAELGRALLLSVPALAMVPLGAYAAHELPESLLLTAIGGMTVLALCAVVIGSRGSFPGGRGGAVTAGAASGLLNSAAGVGGPPLVLYAIGSRWEHERFIATSQLCFAVTNGASVAAKGLPRLPAMELGAAFVTLVAGVALGQLLVGRIPASTARRAVLGLALAGSALTLIKGVLLW